jgi:hypothetical protein
LQVSARRFAVFAVPLSSIRIDPKTKRRAPRSRANDLRSRYDQQTKEKRSARLDA